MLYENEIIEALNKAVHSNFYIDRILLQEIPFLYFRSTLYNNDNRKVVVNVLGDEFEVYSKQDNEDFETIKQRTLYIIKNQLGSMFYQLEKILEKN